MPRKSNNSTKKIASKKSDIQARLVEAEARSAEANARAAEAAADKAAVEVHQPNQISTIIDKASELTDKAGGALKDTAGSIWIWKSIGTGIVFGIILIIVAVILYRNGSTTTGIIVGVFGGGLIAMSGLAYKYRNSENLKRFGAYNEVMSAIRPPTRYVHRGGYFGGGHFGGGHFDDWSDLP
jgi:hypothetical protein